MKNKLYICMFVLLPCCLSASQKPQRVRPADLKVRFQEQVDVCQESLGGIIQKFKLALKEDGGRTFSEQEQQFPDETAED